MSTPINDKRNGLSAVERLKVTEKYLAELEGVLTSMDEIAALRAKGNKKKSDEVGGYKRSSVEKMIVELKKQKNAILNEIEANERSIAARTAAVKRDAEDVRRKAEQSTAEIARKEAEKAVAAYSEKAAKNALSPTDNAVQSFRKGDNSLALESMYTGLSMDIEKMRDDILQEMKYTYKQDMAIYDDLASRIDAISKIDLTALEERLKPLQALVELNEKLDNLQPINYNELAERLSEKVPVQTIDYDKLAGRVAAILAANTAAQGVEVAQLSAVERKLDTVQNTLSGAVSVRQLPEFKKLDALIAEYLHTFSYDLIPDILVTSDSIKNLSNRYILSGNILRGETMLSDLRIRLTRVNVWGGTALSAVNDAIKENSLPMLYSEETFTAFRDACVEFEQSSALADDETANKVIRTKNTLFNDSDQASIDRDTLSELLRLREEIGDQTPDESQVADLTQLKKELMSFNLAGFIDFAPAVAEENHSAVSSVDTETILDAIRHINVTVAAPQAEQKVAPLTDDVKITGVVHSGNSVKKPRVLRPAVSSKDNRTEKTDQPLRTVHRSIKMKDENPDSLSKKLVEELAQKIANTRVK